VNRQWAGRSGVRKAAEEKDLPLVKYFHTGSGDHPASYSMDNTWFFPEGRIAGSLI